jgi:hypothetical protein
MYALFIVPTKAQSVNTTPTIMVVVTNAVAPFLLPVKDRIHETAGLTESVISIMSINNTRMGDSNVLLCSSFGNDPDRVHDAGNVA